MRTKTKTKKKHESTKIVTEMCPCPSPLFAHVVRKQTHTHTHIDTDSGKPARTLTHIYKRSMLTSRRQQTHTHQQRSRGSGRVRETTDIVLFGWNWQLPSARACRQQVYQKYVCHFCCSQRPRLPPFTAPFCSLRQATACVCVCVRHTSVCLSI